MAEAQGKLSGRPGICFVTRGPGREQRRDRPAHRVPGLDADGPVHRPGGERPARPRGVPGGRLPADVRPGHARLRQVGRRGARRRPAARVRRARLPHRAAGAARAGGARAARGHAARRRPRRRCCRASSRRSPRRRPRRWRALRELLAAAERPFVIAGGSGWTPTRARRCERFAERWQLPVGCAFRFQDVFDNRHPNYAGDVGIGINPKLAARIREADLVLAIGPRLGEMTTGGYELLAPPRPRRSSSTSTPAPRSSAASTPPTCCCSRRWPAPRRRWRRSPRRPTSAGPSGPRAAHADYEANLRADAGRAARHGRGREGASQRHAARRHGLHQRRRQLQRLAAPLPSLRGPAPRRPHPARADLGRDGLRRCRPPSPRRCSSRIAPSSTSPATATS